MDEWPILEGRKGTKKWNSWMCPCNKINEKSPVEKPRINRANKALFISPVDVDTVDEMRIFQRFLVHRSRNGKDDARFIRAIRKKGRQIRVANYHPCWISKNYIAASNEKRHSIRTKKKKKIQTGRRRFLRNFHWHCSSTVSWIVFQVCPLE